ncbi:MAG: Spy/CpxP family protein refolding chaperone [Bacteroidota bacterium]
MKSKAAGLLIMVLLVLQNALGAQTPANDRKDCRMPGRKGMIEKLNLTDQQKQEISRIKSEYQKKMIDMRAEIKKLRIDLKTLLAQKDFSESKILSLTDEISKIQSELKRSEVKMWIDSYKQLDEQQKEIWKNRAPMLRENGRLFRERAGKMMERVEKFRKRHMDKTAPRDTTL